MYTWGILLPLKIHFVNVVGRATCKETITRVGSVAAWSGSGRIASLDKRKRPAGCGHKGGPGGKTLTFRGSRGGAPDQGAAGLESTSAKHCAKSLLGKERRSKSCGEDKSKREGERRTRQWLSGRKDQIVRRNVRKDKKMPTRRNLRWCGKSGKKKLMVIAVVKGSEPVEKPRLRNLAGPNTQFDESTHTIQQGSAWRHRVTAGDTTSRR